MARSISALGEKLKGQLQLRSGTRDILRNRESSQLEFKETFNLGSRAKYAKSLAAFANNRGGYIVFGVTNEPHRLKGLNTTNFESCDPAKLTEFFNSHLSPELAWDMDSIEFHGIVLGFLYVHEAQDKPVVAIATNGSDIQEAVMYYRYRGQSTAIKFPELRQLLDERIARERRAWVQHLTSIGRAGPTNVGIVDTVRGKLFGGGPPFLIDENLLRKLKFVRAGQFTESGGSPTLRLIGDVQPLAGVVTERPIHVGIHAEDLITAFLAQRSLDATQATAYLRETIFQASPFAPVHYFFQASGLSEEQVRTLFKESTGAAPATRTRILQRLFAGDRVEPVSPVHTVPTLPKDITTEQFMEQLQEAQSAKGARSLLLAGLRRDPSLIDASSPVLNPSRAAEAVTHLTKADLTVHKAQVLELLLALFEERFAAMEANERSYFRKGICRCDELLFGG